MRSNKSNQKAKSLRNLKKTAQRQVGGPQQQAAIVKVPRNFLRANFPERMCVTMKYIPATNLNNAALTAASRQFQVNGLFDMDPALASTAIAGFVEWMAIYQRYRVRSVKMTADFINLDTSPVVVGLGFDQQFFAANAKNVLAYLQNANQTSRLISAIGGNPVRLEIERDLQHLLGDASLLSEDQYAGTSAANPALPLYGSISAMAGGTGVALVNGVICRSLIECKTEFYQLRNFTV